MPSPALLLSLSAVQILDLLNRLETVVWEWNPRTDVVTFCSPAIEEILGYPVHRWLSEEGFWRGILHPDDAHRCALELQALPAGAPKTLEYRARSAGGEYRWMRSSLCAVDLPGGQTCWRGTTRDVHAQHETELELKNSRSWLHIAQVAAGVGTWEWDIVRNEILWSDEYYPLYGLKPGEMAPSYENWLGTIHPEDRPAVRTLVQAALEQRLPAIEIRFRTLWPNGTVRWLMGRGRLFYDETGQPVRMAGASMDVTEAQKADEERHRLVLLIQRSPDFIGIADTAHQIEFVNAAGLRLVGLNNLGEARAYKIADYVHPDYRHLHDDLMRPAIQAGRPWQGEYCFRHFGTGEPIAVDIRAFPLYDRAGEVSGCACVAQDARDRKRRDEEIKSLSWRLLQLQDVERRNMARELHDGVGQELSALSMNLAVVERARSLLPTRERQALAESMGLLDNCVRQIRTLSYLLHPPLLDEVGLRAALEWFVRGFSDRSGIVTSLSLPPHLGRLPHDVELAVFRIVQESLTNIHRHSGSPSAEVRLDLGAGEARVTVADRGKGLDAPDGAGAGAGVGIGGMRERVRHLGGQLTICSDHRGTRIEATLPLPD